MGLGMLLRVGGGPAISVAGGATVPGMAGGVAGHSVEAVLGPPPAADPIGGGPAAGPFMGPVGGGPTVGGGGPSVIPSTSSLRLMLLITLPHRPPTPEPVELSRLCAPLAPAPPCGGARILSNVAMITFGGVQLNKHIMV